jgi:site-specific DNA-cytosine methylase
MRAYYNDSDPYCAAWLRNLMAAGLIMEGVVDERSIADVQAADLVGFERVHLFGGIAGWELALQLAGWPADRPVWTASCPCQPFSCAGKREGANDERHLWPELFRLIRECGPPVIFGEQVASASVIGRSAKPNENMQEMRDREAVFRVLRQLERQSPVGLHRLREEGGEAEEASEPGTDDGKVQVMAEQQEGPRIGERRQAPSQESRNGLQPRPTGHPEQDRQGLLRTDGNSIRPDDTEGLECTLFRPDRLQQGIHNGQCAGDSLCGERDGEHMGFGQDFADCIGDHGESQESLQRFIRQAWQDSPEAIEPVWFDGIRADLESAGYSVRTCVLGAHGVGAPHIRQRIFWVAQSIREGTGRHTGTALGPQEGVCGARDSDGVQCRDALVAGGPVGRLGIPDSEGPQPGRESTQTDRYGHSTEPAGCGADGMEHAQSRREAATQQPGQRGGIVESSPWSDGLGHADGSQLAEHPAREERQAPARTSWSDYLLIPCRDGKLRRISAEPGFFPLAPRLPGDMGRMFPALAGMVKAARRNRVGRLKGYGNAIVAQVAAEFIKAYEAGDNA